MGTIVYDKKGKEYKVPHKIDVKDWLAAGYTLEKPLTAAEKKALKAKEEVEKKSKEDAEK